MGLKEYTKNPEAAKKERKKRKHNTSSSSSESSDSDREEKTVSKSKKKESKRSSTKNQDQNSHRNNDKDPNPPAPQTYDDFDLPSWSENIDSKNNEDNSNRTRETDSSHNKKKKYSRYSDKEEKGEKNRTSRETKESLEPDMKSHQHDANDSRRSRSRRGRDESNKRYRENDCISQKDENRRDKSKGNRDKIYNRHREGGYSSYKSIDRKSRNRRGSDRKYMDDRYKESYGDFQRDKHIEYGDDVRHNRSRKEHDDNLDRLRSHGERAKDPESEPSENISAKEKRTVDLLTSKTGGAYIPPAKLRMMQAEITDKSGAAYQRIAWEALKKSIHGYINKVNTSNIGLITRELLRENIVRGRGLLARSIIQAQAASPTFTSVYAALTAVINSKFPNIGELLLKRLIIQFKRGFRRNDKPLCISSGTFVAHLVNQRVAHEILALEILTLLVETPTDDSVEVAIAFLKECGMKLTEVSRKGIEAIFEMLRNILHEGQLDKRVQYMIEVMFQIRKDGFKDHEAVSEELDLVEEENQFTHLITLDEATDSQDILNVFKFDSEYVVNEEKYKALSKEILDTDSSGSENSNDEDEEEESSDEDSSNETGEAKKDVIVDNTETNLTALRRTIYLTIHSSLDFEECAHKLMKMQLKPGQEIELCHMFLDCCAEMRTYEKFFGLLAGRFCAINKMYVTPFEQIFKDSYDTIHRLDTNKLRNVSKFFAHLLFTDSISWEVLSCIRLNEEDTTSSSRIFIKILFQELSEYLGLSKLNQRVKDITLQRAFDGLFPRDDPKNTRFAINFFTSIGLGGLTDDLREHLKSRPKPVLVPSVIKESEEESSSTVSSSTSSSSSNSSESSESSDSSSSEEEKKKKKKRSSKENAKKKEQKKHKSKKEETIKSKEKSKKNKKDSKTSKNKLERTKKK
ncbi:pre-mRNA-splicing factor CWC22 homolog [Orussus abietinus]|uniref:pre-mRNA-splicing factor CWC22 homolog n=1 Tax=Orussus abietinus TaxID=222816 RepID=UPI00062607C6|nr:pre-mRNA-splicing factor CWC22 homolog [Orussus abietinus]XP_012288089.1 pre-mRNA-splicing factor CWC22 homolog [Orussus abietinus]